MKNLSIKSKLIIGLVLMASLPIVTLGLSGYGFTQYRSVVDTARDADEIQKLLNKEQNGILQFLSGDQNGGDIYADAHDGFVGIKARLDLESQNEGDHIQSIIAREQQINQMLFGEDGGFFEEFSEAAEVEVSGVLDARDKKDELVGTDGCRQGLIRIEQNAARTHVVAHSLGLNGEEAAVIQTRKVLANLLLDGCGLLYHVGGGLADPGDLAGGAEYSGGRDDNDQ